MKIKYLFVLLILSVSTGVFSQIREQTLKVAEEHMLAQEFELARQQFELLTDMDEKDGEAWLGKGIALDRMKEYNEALECYSKADKYLTDSAFPAYYAGIIHDRYKNYNGSMEAFSYVLEKDTFPLDTYFYIGKSLYLLGNPSGGKDYFYKNLKNYPYHGYTNYYLSKIYYESAELDSAKKYILKASTTQNLPPRFKLLEGDVYFAEGDYSTALLSYSAALNLNPKYFNARMSRAVTYKELKYYSVAIADYDLCLEVEPENMTLLMDKAYCLEKIGDYKNAKSIYKDLEQKNPEDVFIKEALMNLAFETQDYSEVIIICNELIRLNPNGDIYFFEKGNAFQMKGESQLAYESFDKAVKINPKNEAAWFNKAIVAYQLGNEEHACHIWNEMITKGTDPFYHDQAEEKKAKFCN